MATGEKKPNRCVTSKPDKESMDAVCKIVKTLELEKMIKFRSAEKFHCTSIVWKQLQKEVIDEKSKVWNVEEVDIEERYFGEVTKEQRKITFQGLAKLDEFLVVWVDSKVIEKMRQVVLRSLDRQTWRDDKFEPHITIGKFNPGIKEEEIVKLLKECGQEVEKKLQGIKGYFMALSHAEIPYKIRQVRIWES